MELIKSFYVFRTSIRIWKDDDPPDYFIIFMLAKHRKMYMIDFYKWHIDLDWSVKDYMIKGEEMIGDQKYVVYRKNERYEREKLLHILIPGFDSKKIIDIFWW